VGITRFSDTVAGRKFVGNTLAYTGGGEGGAIYNDRQTITFMATTVGNYSTGYSTFTNNVAERGGAIYNLGEAVRFQGEVIETRGEVSFWNINTDGIPVTSNEARFSRNARLVSVRFGGAGAGNQANYGGAIFNT
jgi:hypothetical protein